MAEEFTVAAVTVFAFLLVGCGGGRTLLRSAVIYAVVVVIVVRLTFGVSTNGGSAHAVTAIGSLRKGVATAPGVRQRCSWLVEMTGVPCVSVIT